MIDLLLSPLQIQEIFPIARSDRRLNADIFADFIEPDKLKDDEAFYAALLLMISGDEKGSGTGG